MPGRDSDRCPSTGGPDSPISMGRIPVMLWAAPGAGRPPIPGPGVMDVGEMGVDGPAGRAGSGGTTADTTWGGATAA